MRKVYNMTCFFNGFVLCLLLHVCLFLVFKEHTKNLRMFNHNTRILKFCPKTLCYRACFQFSPWGENNLKCLINYYIISSKNEVVFNIVYRTYVSLCLITGTWNLRSYFKVFPSAPRVKSTSIGKTLASFSTAYEFSWYSVTAATNLCS